MKDIANLKQHIAQSFQVLLETAIEFQHLNNKKVKTEMVAGGLHALILMHLAELRYQFKIGDEDVTEIMQRYFKKKLGGQFMERIEELKRRWPLQELRTRRDSMEPITDHKNEVRNMIKIQDSLISKQGMLNFEIPEDYLALLIISYSQFHILKSMYYEDAVPLALFFTVKPSMLATFDEARSLANRWVLKEPPIKIKSFASLEDWGKASRNLMANLILFFLANEIRMLKLAPSCWEVLCEDSVISDMSQFIIDYLSRIWELGPKSKMAIYKKIDAHHYYVATLMDLVAILVKGFVCLANGHRPKFVRKFGLNILRMQRVGRISYLPEHDGREKGENKTIWDRTNVTIFEILKQEGGLSAFAFFTLIDEASLKWTNSNQYETDKCVYHILALLQHRVNVKKVADDVYGEFPLSEDQKRYFKNNAKSTENVERLYKDIGYLEAIIYSRYFQRVKDRVLYWINLELKDESNYLDGKDKKAYEILKEKIETEYPHYDKNRKKQLLKLEWKSRVRYPEALALIPIEEMAETNVLAILCDFPMTEFEKAWEKKHDVNLWKFIVNLALKQCRQEYDDSLKEVAGLKTRTRDDEKKNDENENFTDASTESKEDEFQAKIIESIEKPKVFALLYLFFKRTLLLKENQRKLILTLLKIYRIYGMKISSKVSLSQEEITQGFLSSHDINQMLSQRLGKKLDVIKKTKERALLIIEKLKPQILGLIQAELSHLD